MKPLKMSAPKSTAGELNSKAHSMKKSAQLRITPITKFFKEVSEKPKLLLALSANPSSPNTSATQSSSASSPVSRSPLKKRNNLTPVKLLSTFEFDFVKIPAVNGHTSSSVKVLDPPTPSSSHTSQSCLSTPKSGASHQSLPPSIEAPLYFPVTTPSPQTQARIEQLASIETPLPPPVKSNPRKRSSPSVNRDMVAGPSVIEISSDSQESDIEVYWKRKQKTGRRVFAGPGKVSADGVIMVDASSESECKPPKEKKSCIESGVKKTISLSKPSRDYKAICTKKHLTESSAPINSLQKLPPCSFPHKSKVDPRLNKTPLRSEGPPQLTSVVKLDNGVGVSKVERVNELQALLWRRGCPYLTKVALGSDKVQLLNSAQSIIVESHLDTSCRFLSAKLDTLAQYLSLVTSPTTMTQGESMASLFLILSDPETLACRVHPDVRDACVSSLRQLLLVHPPGSHQLVDTQYRKFMKALKRRGDSFSVWELVQTLLSSPAGCSQLLSFFVDLLLSDYWASLHSSSGSEPLFLSVFWSSRNQSGMTTPVRQLINELSGLLQAYTPSRNNELVLDSLLTLLYLCATVCPDLSARLGAMCVSLPSKAVHLLLSRLPSHSLYSHLVESLPDIKQTLTKSEEIFASFLQLVPQLQDKKSSEAADKASTEKLSTPPCGLKTMKKLNPSREHSSVSSTVEQKVIWKTVVYDKDKFPCIQVKKSPSKRNGQPKSTDYGCVTHPKSAAALNKGKPVERGNSSSSSINHVKTTKSLPPVPSKKTVNDACLSRYNGHKPHKTYVGSKGKAPAVNGATSSVVESKGQRDSTNRGCVTMPRPSTSLSGLKTAPSHKHLGESSCPKKSAEASPQSKQPVIKKDKLLPSKPHVNSVSKSHLSKRRLNSVSHPANQSKPAMVLHSKPVMSHNKLMSPFTSLNRRPLKNSGFSMSSTRPDTQDVRLSKSAVSAIPVSKTHIGKKNGSLKVERPKSLMATSGTIRRDCENCVSGTCVMPTNTVRMLDV